MKKWMLISLFSLLACQNTPPKSTPAPLSHVDLLPDHSRSQYEAFADHAMISSQGPHSTEAAYEILKKGGNLFDAFTAISFSIGVERPHSTGIGGGGFVMFYDAKTKKVQSLDFRETAPRSAHSKMFIDDKGQAVADRSLTGALAVAVPGEVAGVLEIHRKYGKLSLAEDMAPAIRLAENGFAVYPALHVAIDKEKKRLALFPDSKKLFLTPEGEALPVGFLLRQKDLAQTLKGIAQKGKAGFYQGKVARSIAKTISQFHGHLDEKDLHSYQTKWREPIRGSYGPYEIASQPPPSSGGTHVIEILNILEKDHLKTTGPQSPQSIHLTASAMQRAFVDRAQYMGDPDFVSVPVQMLTSKDYAAKARAQIDPTKAHNVEQAGQKIESPETTHFSLMDSDGNAIASTQTINGYFGSAMVAQGTGIVLNNEMDDFAAQVGGHNLFGAVGGEKNLVQAGKRPLSSMSPTLVFKDGKAFLALGTPSGTRIITCVAQTILNVIEYDLPLWDAMTVTRYHEQWQPDELQIESPLFPSETLENLRARGWKIKEQSPSCRVQAIENEKGHLHGVSDPREEGSSLGL